MLLRYVILSLLCDEGMHGYRIKYAFEERLGKIWPINFGQIYAVLKDLKRRGLIVGRLESDGSHLGRWVYEATARGRRSLATWLARRPRPPVPIRNEIFVRLLATGREDLEGSLAQLESQERVYRAYVEELRERRVALERAEAATHDPDILAGLAVDATIYQVEAHLRWLEHCGEAIRRNSPECRMKAREPAAASRSRPMRKRQRRADDVPARRQRSA
jgi:DNA-binding PadR family transcriptional regulator